MMTGVELAIPDPRRETVPRDWWESVARPAIIGCETMGELDEIEARLLAFMSYIEALNGDALEFAKALRCVEARRGELLGAARPETEPLTRVLEVEASPMTQSRWRTIADHWDDLEPVVRGATDARQVSQARLLRIASGVETGDGLADAVRRASRAQVLEAAILTHRTATQALCAENDWGPTDADKALWANIDEKVTS